MGPIDYRRLREQLDARKVCQLLKIEPRRRGPCPVHGSTSPRSRVFSLDISGAGRFQCFKCGAAGNALDLYAAVRKITLYAAALEVCDQLGLVVPWLKLKPTITITADGNGIRRQVSLHE